MSVNTFLNLQRGKLTKVRGELSMLPSPIQHNRHCLVNRRGDRSVPTVVKERESGGAPETFRHPEAQNLQALKIVFYLPSRLVFL